MASPLEERLLEAVQWEHFPIMAKPAGIMCHCDRVWRDVPTYRKHLREVVNVGLWVIRVEIEERLNEPAICKVWRDGVLVFHGRDFSIEVRGGSSSDRPAQP